MLRDRSFKVACFSVSSGERIAVVPARVLPSLLDCLLCRFDGLLPEAFRVDGNRELLDKVVPAFVLPRTVVYDVGGGKNPVVDPQRKAELGLRVWIPLGEAIQKTLAWQRSAKAILSR